MNEEKEKNRERVKEKEKLVKLERTNKARRVAGFAELPEVTESRKEAQKEGNEKVKKYNKEHPAKTGPEYDLDNCKVFQTNVANMAAAKFLKGLYKVSSAAASGISKEETRNNKDTFGVLLNELRTTPSQIGLVEHLCIDTGALDMLMDRVMKKSVELKKQSGHSALFTSTIDSFNRMRDAKMVKDYIGLAEEGNDSVSYRVHENGIRRPRPLR